MDKRKKLFLGLSAVLLSIFMAPMLYSHCQIPCGIYDDPARIKMIEEEIATVEKSMTEINTLSANPGQNMNQIVRWVNNKETHADGLSEIVTYYFMAQRVKPADKTDVQARQQYVNQLTILHEMLITSMKCKQTTDLENIRKLRQLLDEFVKVYMNKDVSTVPEKTIGRESK